MRVVVVFVWENCSTEIGYFLKTTTDIVLYLKIRHILFLLLRGYKLCTKEEYRTFFLNYYDIKQRRDYTLIAEYDNKLTSK